MQLGLRGAAGQSLSAADLDGFRAWQHGTVTVLIPLPDGDFDVTEVAVPWKLLVEAGHVCCSRPRPARRPACDPLLIDRRGLRQARRAARPDRVATASSRRAAEFVSPVRWARASTSRVRRAVPAGRSRARDEAVPRQRGCPGAGRRHSSPRASRSAAICHGVLVARARDPAAAPCCTAGAPPACRSTWSAARTSRRSGGAAATTGPTPRTSRTRSRAALATPDDFVRGPRTLSKRGTARRRHRGVCRRGRQLRLGTLARRCVAVRQEAGRAIAVTRTRARITSGS